MTIEKLRKAIAYGGANQSKVAEVIGISRGAFNTRLKQCRFSDDELNKIAKVLGAEYEENFVFPDGTKI